MPLRENYENLVNNIIIMFFLVKLQYVFRLIKVKSSWCIFIKHYLSYLNMTHTQLSLSV
jgi:hypothetical protein